MKVCRPAQQIARGHLSVFASAAIASILWTTPAVSAQDSVGAFTDMIDGGTTRIALRYRFEEVEQDNILRDARASTLRTRLTFQSATVNRFSFMLEADNVLTLGPDHYDSFVLDRYRGTHSVIADPVGSEVNQASVRYAFSEGRHLTAGRQRLNHATQRFLGSVGWRQNEQTMDALTYAHATDGFTLDYSYLWNVNRVFKGSRSSVQAGDFDSNSHALMVGRRSDLGTFSGFLYAYDFDNAAAASSISYGISYTGTFGALNVAATYAHQTDYADNPQSYDADYLLLEGSGKLGVMTLLLGYEVLGSDSGRAAFSTPLATLHRYQGFADMFLTTPANGIRDAYATVSGPMGPLTVSATWHQYDADKGGADYGSELNLAAGYIINPRLNVEAKYADYNSDGFSVDTRKLWLTLNLTF